MHPLSMVLMIFIMAAMSGFNGFRPTGDFIKKHKQELVKLFQPKNNRLPSFQTIARILENIDFDKLTNIFHRWASSRVIVGQAELIKASEIILKQPLTCSTPGQSLNPAARPGAKPSTARPVAIS